MLKAKKHPVRAAAALRFRPRVDRLGFDADGHERGGGWQGAVAQQEGPAHQGPPTFRDRRVKVVWWGLAAL